MRDRTVTLATGLQVNTLVDLSQYRALHQPNKVAYTFLLDGETHAISLTYQELDQQAQSIAARLQHCGSPGDRVLLLYSPGLEYIAAFFGCLYAGMIAVPAYLPRPNRSLETLAAITADAQVTIVLTTEKTVANLKRYNLQSFVLSTCEWITTDTINGADQFWEPCKNSPDTLALLQYTSGSTSTPKGVMITHQNLLHNLGVISKGFDTTPQSKGIIWLPPYHDMGLIGGILQPLYGGFPVILMSPLMFLQSPFRWLQSISHHRGTISGGPNFAYDLCVKKITPEQRDSLDLSCWDVAFNGAEPISPQVLKDFAEMFGPCGFRLEAFYPCYGLAEATLMVSGGNKKTPPMVKSFSNFSLSQSHISSEAVSKEASIALVSCGRVSSQRIRIVDPQTHQTCLAGEVGEIWLSGPSIAQGYWQKSEETMRTFRAYLADTGQGPFLRTGDLGLLDRDELFVTGRLKDLIILHGCNHYPQDIERTIEAYVPVIRPHSSAAFSVEVDGIEKLILVAELERRYWQLWKKANDNTPTSTANDTDSDLQRFTQNLKNTVTREHSLNPEIVLLLKPGSLPKTSSGKVQRYLCRERFLAGALK